jgi:hypothetical protein
MAPRLAIKQVAMAGPRIREQRDHPTPVGTVRQQAADDRQQPEQRVDGEFAQADHEG